MLSSLGDWFLGPVDSPKADAGSPDAEASHFALALLRYLLRLMMTNPHIVRLRVATVDGPLIAAPLRTSEWEVQR